MTQSTSSAAGRTQQWEPAVGYSWWERDRSWRALGASQTSLGAAVRAWMHPAALGQVLVLLGPGDPPQPWISTAGLGERDGHRDLGKASLGGQWPRVTPCQGQGWGGLRPHPSSAQRLNRGRKPLFLKEQEGGHLLWGVGGPSWPPFSHSSVQELGLATAGRGAGQRMGRRMTPHPHPPRFGDEGGVVPAAGPHCCSAATMG